jgi:hypothetical protein
MMNKTKQFEQSIDSRPKSDSEEQDLTEETQMRDKTGTETNTQVDLGEAMTYHEDGRCTNAFQLITSETVLLSAYRTLRSKPGMMTKGIDQETLDGIDMK